MKKVIGNALFVAIVVSLFTSGAEASAAILTRPGSAAGTGTYNAGSAGAETNDAGESAAASADGTVTISQEEYDRLSRFEKLAEIYDEIEYYYYIEPDEEAMLRGAIDGMLLGLDDPYTFYYSPDDWEGMWEADSAEYAGIGIEMMADYENDTVTISRVFKNSPAEREGVRRGDRLIRVEDMTVTAETMSEASALIKSKEEGPVSVEVIRGDESLTFSLTPEVINATWVETAMLEDSVGLLVFYEFSDQADEMFAEGLAELEAQGAKALIVDLRGNSGGWLDIAESIGDIFLDRKLLYYTEDRQGYREEYYTTDGKDDIPLVILINGDSASASELLSGSLQDSGRALLVGETSYGKGVLQYVDTLSGVDGREDGIQITIAQYFLPSGKAVHKVGITPDITVEMPEELAGTLFDLGDMSDPQLKRAWEEAVALMEAEEAGSDTAADAAEEPAA